MITRTTAYPVKPSPQGLPLPMIPSVLIYDHDYVFLSSEHPLHLQLSFDFMAFSIVLAKFLQASLMARVTVLELCGL